MQRLEDELRGTGIPGDPELADQLATRVQTHGDIVFSEKPHPTIERFSEHGLQTLDTLGATMRLILDGKSIREMRKTGVRVGFNWDDSMTFFDESESDACEIAVNPQQLFLPGNVGLTANQAHDLISGYTEQKLRSGYGDVLVHIPHPATLIALELEYERRNDGKELFGPYPFEYKGPTHAYVRAYSDPRGRYTNEKMLLVNYGRERGGIQILRQLDGLDFNDPTKLTHLKTGVAAVYYPFNIPH